MIDSNADPTPDSTLTRRALLRAAAGLAGVLALGLEASDACALPISPGGLGAGAPLALAFWDGTRLLDPTRMHPDRTLAGASLRLTLRSRPVGEVPTLHALTAHFPDADGPAPAWTPFTAWAASPGDSERGIAFTMPVHPAWGLLLSAETGPAASRGQTVCRLDVGGGRGTPKLRVGTYLLAPAGTDWTGWSPGDWEPAAFDSLVLTVARA